MSTETEKTLNDLFMDAICFATDFWIEPLYRVFEIGQPVLYLDITNKTLIDGIVEGYHISASANRFDIFYEVRLGDLTAKIHPNLLIPSDKTYQYHQDNHDNQNPTDCNCTRG